MARPAELIAVAVRNLEREVPALGPLKLVVRLELRGRGDVQVFRVRLPGPEVTKGEPDDARVQVALSRSIGGKCHHHRLSPRADNCCRGFPV